ncbi:MAG: DUF6036 family nucleotidyltransferase [Pyrinomonadaceae bacterium]
MDLLIEEAARFQEFVIKNEWEFYFGGGLAVQIWGEPRLTRDIYLTIFTNFDNEPAFVDTIIAKYRPKYADAPKFALSERILPVLTETGITIDVALSGFSDLSESLERASYQHFFGDISLKVCSPDDLVVMKTLAGRSRDWPDVEAVLIKQSNLDWEYIERSICQLFEYEQEIEEKYCKLSLLKARHHRP